MSSSAWLISAVTTVFLALATLFIYANISNPNLPPGWGGFFLGLAMILVFTMLLIISVVSAVITLIYFFGFYKAGLALSIIMAIIIFMTTPGLIIFAIPHLIAGVAGVR